MIRPLLATLILAALSACRPQPTAAQSSAVQGPATSTLIPQLQSRYQGQNVWVYGGGPLGCRRGQSRVDLRGSVSDPVRVVTLRRLLGRAAVKTTHGGTVPTQTVDRPFELVLRPGPSFKWVSGGGSSEADLQALMKSGCTQLTQLYADLDHIERELSLTPPDAATRRAFQARPQPSSRLGLTHLQALWLLGAPEAPVTRLDRLLRAPLWTTYGPPGYGDWTLNFISDRVVAETAPSPMP